MSETLLDDSCAPPSWPILQFQLAAAEVDRGSVGWVQKGKELAPASVQFTRLFMAPEAKFLLLWHGDRIMSVACYERMNGDPALGMCARKG